MHVRTHKLWAYTEIIRERGLVKGEVILKCGFKENIIIAYNINNARELLKNIYKIKLKNITF